MNDSTREPSAADPSQSMWQGEIAEGPDADGKFGKRRKGLVPARALRMQGDAGRVMDIAHRPRPDAVPVRIRSIREIGGFRFPVCPICLSPDPASREHVPPASFGGGVRTRVCHRCNNDLGSRIEVAFLDWRDDAVRNARASSDNVPGRRRLERMLYRTAGDGQFVLIPDGRVDSAFRDMLTSGGFQYTYAPPEAARYKLAALKHAYLAACLDRQEVPDTPAAREIRRDLVAARDAPADGAFPTSEYAMRLPLMRSYSQPGGPSLALCLADTGGADRAAEVWIVLAGNVCVPWPMPDFPPVL